MKLFILGHFSDIFWTDRQIYRPTDRQTDRQTDEQTDRQTDIVVYREATLPKRGLSTILTAYLSD